MRKIIIIIVLLANACIAYNQTKKVSLGLLLYPSVDYRMIRGELKKLGIDHKPISTADAGMSFTYHFAANTSVESGLIYSFYGYKAKAEITVNDGSTSTEHTLKLRLNAVNIPLMINFHSNKKSVVSVGISNNINFKVTDVYKFNPETEPYTDTITFIKGFKELKDRKYRIYNPGIDLSYSRNISFQNNWQLTIGPSFSFQVFDFQKTNDVKCYKFGIRVVLRKFSAIDKEQANND